MGRPPRARGRLATRPDGRVVERKTPACAGTTNRRPRVRSVMREDPRVRGDDPTLREPPNRSVGRPPRARGRRYRDARGGGDRGKTPACAGTTTRRRKSARRAEEDPRVRGDDASTGTIASRKCGRPPRARGRRRTPPGPAGRDRKTPACAGTTHRWAASPTRQAEDPRVRGDDVYYVVSKATNTGRPPRARGRQPVEQGVPLGVGKTPACAGTTRGRQQRPRRRPEDPRVRGDDVGPSAPFFVCAGRPPRARGRRVERG